MLQTEYVLFGKMFWRRFACLLIKALGGLRMHKEQDGYFLDPLFILFFLFFCVIMFLIKKNYTAKNEQMLEWCRWKFSLAALGERCYQFNLNFLILRLQWRKVTCCLLLG